MKNAINAIDEEMIECNANFILHSANCWYEWWGMQSIEISVNDQISKYIDVNNKDCFMSLMAIDPQLALFLDPVASKIFI